MLRASRAIVSFRRSALVLAPRAQTFHVSARRQNDAKEVEKPKEVVDADSGWYTPAYGIAGGIALAVPAIHYQWYLINEETQVRRSADYYPKILGIVLALL